MIHDDTNHNSTEQNKKHADRQIFQLTLMLMSYSVVRRHVCMYVFHPILPTNKSLHVSKGTHHMCNGALG